MKVMGQNQVNFLTGKKKGKKETPKIWQWENGMWVCLGVCFYSSFSQAVWGSNRRTC
jgi:hypothetical protein